jgi:hypothetical protein
MEGRFGGVAAGPGPAVGGVLELGAAGATAARTGVLATAGGRAAGMGGETSAGFGFNVKTGRELGGDIGAVVAAIGAIGFGLKRAAAAAMRARRLILSVMTSTRSRSA